MNGWALLFQMNLLIVFMSVGMLWVAMVFITTLKDYYFITWSFFAGALITLPSGIFLGKLFGLSGYMMAFSIGQFTIFLGLTLRIFSEFPSERALNFDFLAYLKRYPMLVGIGIFYNLGIWIDKFLFWISHHGQQIDSFLYASFIYDLPMFLAYITIIPAYSIFIVRTETEFYPRYQNYYATVTGKKSMRQIMAVKAEMISNTIGQIWFTIRVQGLVSIVVLLSAPHIMGYLKMDWFQMVVFRLGTLGAFLQALIGILFIFLLYFDFRKECFIVTFLFFMSNMIFTYISLQVGFPYLGMGYLGASALTLFVGVWILDYKIQNLEYLTFMKQPI